MGEAHWTDGGPASGDIFLESLKEFFLGPIAALRGADLTAERVTDRGRMSDTLRLARSLLAYLIEIAIGLLIFLLLWLISFSIQLLSIRLFDSMITSLTATMAFVALVCLASFLVRSTLKLIERV